MDLEYDEAGGCRDQACGDRVEVDGSTLAGDAKKAEGMALSVWPPPSVTTRAVVGRSIPCWPKVGELNGGGSEVGDPVITAATQCRGDEQRFLPVHTVSEKARAKDTHTLAQEGTSNANLVHKSNAKNKGKQAVQNHKPKNTTNFKKKKITCYVCSLEGQKANKCCGKKGKKIRQQEQNIANMVVSEPLSSGYDFTPVALLAFQSLDLWVDTGANIHVSADINSFSSYQAASSTSILKGNGSSVVFLGTGKVGLKLTSGKLIPLKNVQHMPSIKRNLVNGSLLCRDGYKLVFESNKLVISKFSLFLGKGYECGGFFRESLLDTSNKFVSNVLSNFHKNVTIWHSNISIVNASKCQICVQAMQPHKPFQAVEERNLTPLELVHLDLCEMNEVLTKARKRCFISFIDDGTRFCYQYLLKSKDEALNYFKIYRPRLKIK
uniref:Retrovirus-related Pol polyprotein from transposon TNT 1-94-like beta-barrel domain-containing protein n=1 Tax=Oryza brachyantha TaxID=4533 RepID=J3MWC6_ORYBR